MKRASYREAVAFAADINNDVTDPEEMQGLVTVSLISYLFVVPHAKVVSDILREREKAAA